MFPAGSGIAPKITNLTLACDLMGKSVINFDCNKSILNSVCELKIYDVVNNYNVVWSGSISQYVNSAPFEVKGLANSTYSLIADNGENRTDISFFVYCSNSGATLNILSVDVVDATGKLLSDGSAVATISDIHGSNPSTVETHTGDFNWVAAVENPPETYKATYANLKPGKYTVYARNTEGALAQYSFIVSYPIIYGCTNKAASNYNSTATDDDGSCIIPQPKPKPFIYVPLMNSFRYTNAQPVANDLATLDSRDYNKGESWQGITRPIYYQKVNRTDVMITQFMSNYSNHVCEIRNAKNDSLVKTLAVNSRQTNIGITRQYPGWITPNDVNTSRLYFNGGILPLKFIIGDTAQVLNAIPAAVNNQYTITAISFDSIQSIPYLVIDLVFPQVTPTPNRINATIQTVYDTLPYNVYDFTPDWASIVNGLYYAEIKAFSSTQILPSVIFRSDIFALYENHPGTNLITYRNLDDKDDLVFTVGLICCLRVESEDWQRLPAGTRKTDRTPDNQIRKLYGRRQRKFKFSAFRLPPWLHEKLAFAFDFDRVTVNGMQVQSEDGYSEPGYVNRYALSNAGITLEVVESTTLGSGIAGDSGARHNPFVIVNGVQLLQI